MAITRIHAIKATVSGAVNYICNEKKTDSSLLISSFGGTVAGAIYDKTQSFMSVFIIMMVAAAIGALLVLLLRKPVKK